MAGNALTHRVGPLPVWGWMAAAGLGIVLYLRHANATAAAGQQASSAPGFIDPNAVDPTTGLTYGQEMGGAGQLTPTTGASTDSGGATTPGQTISGEIGDVAGIVGALQGLAQMFTPAPSDGTQTGQGGGGGGGGGSKRASKRGGKRRQSQQQHRPQAKRSSKHRAPAHPNENTAHRAHPHHAPPPARTRVRTHKRGRRW